MSKAILSPEKSLPVPPWWNHGEPPSDIQLEVWRKEQQRVTDDLLKAIREYKEFHDKGI